MKNYDNQYSILLYEIKKLPDSEIKREFYIDLERAIKSLDNEYKENIIKALFMRIDFIKKELNLNNHDENSYYIDKKKISTSTISKSETQVNSFFAISSLITSVILDSCNDIKYIRNSPFISKRIDKLIDEIHDEMISINNNQKEKLKNAFASKMKLEEIRTFIENYNNNEDNINDIYDKLLSIYNDKINSYLDKLNKVYEKMNDYEQEVFDNWNTLHKLYKGFFSICIDRALLSNKTLIARLKNMLKIRADYTTIIQADGSPMSGGEDDFKTTLQAVATAELIQKENIPVYILLSGGTNSKSKKLADLCNVDISGVAIGSFARKIVKNYLYGNMCEDEAVKIAKNLVESIY